MNDLNKECFGILDRVFPLGEEGLRQIVPTCFDCSDRKACLQAAMLTREGFVFRSEIVDRAPVGGLVGRFKRWSEKKELNRLIKQNKGRKS